jgi:hypothetical protein
MDGIDGEAIWLFCPGLTDELVGRQSTKGLEAASEVIGGDEVREVVVQLLLAFVVIALDGGLFESSVHSFDLPLGPWMVGLGEPMLDAVLSARAVERMTAPHRGGFRAVLWQIGELDAVVGQDGENLVGNGFYQGLKKVRCRAGGSSLVQFVERQRMSTESDDDCLLLDRLRVLGASRQSGTEPRFRHLATVFGFMP